MESSFFDDLLKRDVDQNAVNAIVGSLESQVSSVSSSSNKLINSSSHSTTLLANDGGKIATAGPIDSSATNHIQISSRIAPINGSSQNLSVANSVIASNSIIGKPTSTVRSSTPNKQSPSPTISANSSQVNIAPKNVLSNTVPIAPRMPTTIMLTPQLSQMLAAQGFAGTALVPSNLVGNVRMAGTPLPLAPRLTGPNTVTAVSGINLMTGQIPGVQNIVSRLPAPQPVILTQNAKQEPNTSTGRGNSPKPNTIAMQAPLSSAVTIGLPSSTLTQVKGTSPVPGVVTYRFRQVNPAAAVSNINASNVAVMKESVKKLKEFFQNLISLACGPNQPPDIGRSVKELVQNVMYNKMNEEEFVEKLQLTLKSDPQPNLVPFLKRTLPHLRETMKQQSKVQTTQPIQQPLKMQEELQKVALSTSQTQVQKSQVQSTVNLLANQKTTPAALQAAVMQINTNSQQNLAQSQQALLNRTLALHRQQMMQKQMVQGDRIIHNPAGIGKDIATVMKAVTGQSQVLVNATAAQAEKSKHKAAFHYSSAMTSNDDDINDVTCMAGVNLMEESAKILSTGSELLGSQTRSCKDEVFLSTEPLKRKIEAIVKKHKIRDAQQDVISMVSHATEERLRNIIERLSVLSLHRVEAHKEHPSFEVVSDVKSQLRVFEQIDEVERKHREAREREMLMRVAKSRSRTEDPEQARLKEKAKQLQQEEEELLRKRAANKTALEAIGPRKKRKLDEALESLSTAHTSDPSNNDASSSSQLQPMRLRTRRITMRDLQFVLEQDRESSRSMLLFKSYLR
ncbi:transcription initiation factor TFIID subunit 4-like [Rhopilema esculentum]|uniref:transcription initiation factor TFIID subunit 4-like n=1 Tax=Rhopilema esculentum TaxID=499914 RepID=UPI0031E487BA